MTVFAAPQRQPRSQPQRSQGCARLRVHWDYFDYESDSGIWQFRGPCGDVPARLLVSEHCPCGWRTRGLWCNDCVEANVQESRSNADIGGLLWCPGCEGWTLTFSRAHRWLLRPIDGA